MMNPTLQRKLAKLVGQLKEQKERFGSFDKLAEAIRTATGSADPPIDRRKLSDLIGEKPVEKLHLTVHEVLALDLYFQRSGGLTGVTRVASVLESAAAVGRVMFLVGSKSIGTLDRGLDYVSRWDMQ